MISIKNWQATIVLLILIIASAVIAFIAQSEPWYHHDESMYFESSDTLYGSETTFYLDKWTHNDYSLNSSTTHNYTYHQYSTFWLPLNPIHSFMGTVEMLVELSVVMALLVVIPAVFRLRTIELFMGVASAVLFAGAPIMFFLGFVDACNETNLPYIDELSSFIGSHRSEEYFGIDREVWGPMSAFWLMLVACAVQSAGVVFAYKFRKS